VTDPKTDRLGHRGIGRGSGDVVADAVQYGSFGGNRHERVIAHDETAGMRRNEKRPFGVF